MRDERIFLRTCPASATGGPAGEPGRPAGRGRGGGGPEAEQL